MANLYSTVPYKGRPEKEQYLALMAKAEAEHDWECLKPYPMLLCIWQGKHRNDLMDIARWVSHFRMPFLKPDYTVIPVTIQHKGTASSEEQYHMGKTSYGHELCADNCGTHDYRTGDINAPTLSL